MPDDELKRLKLEKLVEARVREALAIHKAEMEKELVTMFIIRLSKYETAYNIGKFVVVAVALMLIGTAYQLFISIANSQGIK